MHVLPQASLIVLLHVYVSVHELPQASVHVNPQASVLTVDVPRVYLLFYTTHSCEATLAMYLGQLMSTSGVLLGIYCIIYQNRRNVAPCNGLANKSAYIYPIGQYFRENLP